MKKIIFIHIGSFLGIFALMVCLYVLSITNEKSDHAPVAIEVSLDIFGILFLITALLIWLRAWWFFFKQWSVQTTEQNLIALAALLIGNIFGAYFLLYINRNKTLQP